MIAKELIEARWRMLIGGLLSVLAAAGIVFSYSLIQDLLNSPSLQTLPAGAQAQIGRSLGDFDIYAWSQWFARNAGLILGGVAAFLGGGLIAGEVNKGTIFLLLSRPVSRTQVLAIKYGVAAGILLAISLLGGLAVLVCAALLGHPQPIGGVVISVVLLWLGTLFVLGVALLFSVVFDDALRPVGLALAVGILIGVPGLFAAFAPGWETWSLPHYWASLPAYLGTGFPGQELAVCLIAALLPVALALPLFRARAY